MISRLRRRWPLVPQYFALAALAILCLASFLAPPEPAFRMEVWSRSVATAQLFFDHGDGFTDADVRIVTLAASRCVGDLPAGASPPCPPQTASFPLAPGRYRALRMIVIPPAEGAAQAVYLRDPRLVTGDRETDRFFVPAALIHKESTIFADRFDGGVKIVTEPPTPFAEFFLDFAKEPVRISGWLPGERAAAVLACVLAAMVAVALVDRRLRATATGPA